MNDWAEFRHFKYLLAIAEYKGFRAAAEHLHTAEPNLASRRSSFKRLSAFVSSSEPPAGAFNSPRLGLLSNLLLATCLRLEMRRLRP